MTQVLPWVAVLIAAGVILARDSSVQSADGPTPTWVALRERGPLFLVLAVLAGVALLAGWKWGEDLPGFMPSAWGLLLGFAVAGLSYAAEQAPTRLAGVATPLAIGLAGVGVASTAGVELASYVSLGLVAGAGLGAWILSAGSDEATWPSLAAIYATAAFAANYLGGISPGEKAGEAGLALGLVAVLSALLGVGIARLLEKQRGSVRAGMSVVVALVLLLLGGTIVGRRYLYLDDTWLIFNGAVGLALAVHWLLPERVLKNSLGFLLGAVLWIALATLAFGLRKGFGMSLALLGGSSALLILGNRRALMTMGPLLALVVFRVFRESHTDALRALDIGQHYAIVGLLIGAALPLIPLDWSRQVASSRVAGIAFAAAIWFALLVAVNPAMGLLLGAKGVVGFLVGLGLSSAIEGLRGGFSLQMLSLPAGMGALATVIYGWLGDRLDQTRDEKVQMLPYVLGAIFVLAALIAALTNRTGGTVEEPA